MTQPEQEETRREDVVVIEEVERVGPLQESPERRSRREELEKAEIEAIRQGFDAMVTQEIAQQQAEIQAGTRSAHPERPLLSPLENAGAVGKAIVSRLVDVLLPRKFDRIESSVLGLDLFKKDKVTERMLSDGTELRPGDDYARLHLTLERWRPKKPEVEEDFKWVLDELATRFATDPRYRDVKAVHCVSHLFGNEKNAEQFRAIGFQMDDVNFIQRAFHGVVGGAEYLFARGPLSFLKKIGKMKVREGWISRDQLLEYQKKNPIV